MRALIIFIFLSQCCFAQSKQAIFKMLPKECTPQLSAAEREFLFNHGSYILPDGDSIETIKYELDTAAGEPGYFNYGYSYTTGQYGFLFFEVLSLQKVSGSNLIMFSRVGGVPKVFYQQELRFFNVVKGKLVESKEQLLPVEPDLRPFLLADTPDSVMSKIDKLVNYSYDLSTEEEGVITFRVLFDTSVMKYMKKDIVYYRWNGKLFVEENE